MGLVRSGFIPIPVGAKPGFDHADIYRPGLPGVAGVLIDDEHDLLFTSDREIGRVSVFRCSDEQLLGQVEVGPHPNGLAYDRERRHLYSFNLGEPLGENSTASLVALDSLRVVAELPLPG